MFETRTYDDPLVLPPAIRARWEFLETSSAAAVLRSVCPDEWADIVSVLDTFRLDPPHWLKAGGNRGDIAKTIDEMFARHRRPGWTLWGNEADDSVTPRGVVHKGYAGGPILPQLKPNEHIEHDRAEAMGRKLRDRYLKGESVRELVEATGYSIQRVRALLAAAGTPMRPRGRHLGQAQLEMPIRKAGRSK
ncbi:BglII/BstYI family type II restriction endonuclease [Stenotrophomonas muris]|uniref:BglII/BstYI family type II restriction endonuclease n=1 Tax=Stenotrophomonas muris TaxID=2963283 RepID=UPI003CE5AB78